MILYTEKNGAYYNLNEFKKDLSDLSENGFHNKIYINMTNRCSCACTFCLRSLKEFGEDNSLWLKEEPTVEEIKNLFSEYDWSKVAEIVFCGFGEPTMRLDDLLFVASWLKSVHPDVPIRINTNGLADLVHGEDTARRMEGLIDTLSISLNASNKEEYLRLTRNPYGLSSYESMLKFARNAKKYVPHVVMTVVDIIGEEEVAACQKICDDQGLFLRVRPYESH